MKLHVKRYSNNGYPVLSRKFLKSLSDARTSVEELPCNEGGRPYVCKIETPGQQELLLSRQKKRKPRGNARVKKTLHPHAIPRKLSKENAAGISQALDAAVGHHRAGRFAEAAMIYNAILADYPEQADATHLLGMLLHQQGQNEKAITLLEKAVSLDPANESALNNLGVAMLATGNVCGAVARFRKALALSPNFFEARNNLGNALAEARDFEAAETAYKQALTARPDTPEVLNNLASTLNELVRPEEAIDVCERAITLNPGYAEVYNTLGNALAMLGRLDEAVSRYRQALAIKPDFAMAHWQISRIKEFKEQDDSVAAMTKLIESPGNSDTQRMHLAFSLGKAYEDLKDYDRAFHYLTIGNKLKRAGLEFDITRAEQHFAEIKAVFSAAFFAKRLSAAEETGLADETPIFIVGMPRSGTSLIEQILSSHSAVHGAGELGALRTSLSGHLGQFDDASPLPDADAITNRNILDAAKDYIAVLRQHSGSARFITDKMPHNFELIGMIRLMLPNAKIINCLRDPADNGYSLFKVNFSSSEYGYAYDLSEIARYYK